MALVKTENSRRIEDPSLEDAIVKALSAFPGKAKGCSDAQWTYGIKQLLCKLGVERNYKPCTSGFQDAFEPEWLYDLIWYHNDAQDQLIEIPLVMECEWSLDISDIQYDFEKLLLAKASLRVMIFQANTRRGTEEVVRHLITGITKFVGSVRGDRYLFVAYDDQTKDFSFRPFVY